MLSLYSIGPSWSTGSPITFITRPSVPRPTGTEMGPPWSMAFMPRTMPSVGFHGDAAHAAFAKMLLNFEDHFDRDGNGEAVADDSQRLIDGRQVAFGEIARPPPARRFGLRVLHFLP